MKILVIEDDKRIADSIKQGLEQESYAVDVSYDGESGYDFAAGEAYDAIILDRMLPNKSGMEIIKDLRNEEITTPVLLLTAKGQTEDKVEGLNAGADDYLAKPFAFDELLARIRALARRPKNTLPITIVYDDLSLNTLTFEVKRGNTIVKLSKKEYGLLEYMLKNKNKTLTKEQIIDNVWNFDADILPNTVEVYIGYLRKKIDKAFSKSNKLIHTVRGFGYKLGT